LPRSERGASEQPAAFRCVLRFNGERQAKLGHHPGSPASIRSDLVPEEIDHASGSVDQRGERTDPRRGEHRARSQLTHPGRPAQYSRPVTQALRGRLETAQSREDPAPIADRRARAQQLPAFPVPGRVRNLNGLAEFLGGISGRESGLAELLSHRIAETGDEPVGHLGSQNFLVRAQRVLDGLLPAPISWPVASQKNRQRGSQIDPEFGQRVGNRRTIAGTVRILTSYRNLFDYPVVEQTKRI